MRDRGSITKVWNNARIAARNAVVREVMRSAGIPTVDLFHASLAMAAWPQHWHDNLHLVKWNNAVLADMLLHFVCTEDHMS
eukprot:NODE_3381_length_781_cov_16.446721_g2824_i0.p2 GENE.NODE_3381_length_781_cov_16.446721_g2824_i0~~NODE_3381_length_781_cov_16.446721_g2824_i0.p2  ORF type:complete len:81 (+),score=19.89 NODE_3381_length_781_cov_16.446721_g2824_i0:434-676(+)